VPPAALKLRIVKYHALGNSYLVLDPRRAGPDLSRLKAVNSDFPAESLVRMLCNPSIGIGSHGLLFGPLPSFKGSAFGLAIINSDGTAAGFSGNGTRIFAQYLLDAGDARLGETVQLEIAEPKDSTIVKHVAPVVLPDRPAGAIKVTAPQTPRFGAEAVAARAGLTPETLTTGTHPPCYSLSALVSLGSELMGTPSAWASSIPVEIGNPHLVTLVRSASHLPDADGLRAHDAALRAIAFASRSPSASFPAGINLQWAWPESRKRLRLVIYERGEGPTPASGSSACAAACAAFARGLIDAEVEVVMPGGNLAVSLEGTPDKPKAVSLAGYAKRILEAVVDVDASATGAPAPA